MGAAQNYVGVSRRPPDVEDYIDMARRYRSWIVGPMFAGLVASVVVGFLQPDTFVSYATMRLTPQQVPEKLIPSVMNSSQLAERVQQLETEILSRGVLQDIIQKPSLDLYPKDRRRLPMEDVVTTMKNRDIHIIPISSGGDRRLNAFQITFRYIDRFKASAVVRELVAQFESKNVNVLHNQSAMTNTFLTDEKQKAQDRMDKLGAAVTRFEMENQGRLPQQATQNNAAWLQIQMQILQINATINRDQQDKLALSTNLDNLRNEQNYLAANMETVIPGSGPMSIKNEKLLNLSKQLTDYRSKLASAKKIYGDNWPEISQMQAQIDSLEAEEADLQKQESAQAANASNGATPARTVVNPEKEKQMLDYQAQQKSLKTQLDSKNLEIEELTRQRGELAKQEAMYRKRIDEAPLNEQQYAQLQSEYQMAKTAYQDMVKKQEQSDTSQNLEEHKAGENLEVLDQATTPDKPVAPDRLVYAATGTFGGLLVGLMLAAGKEVKNTALKNLKDVRAYTNLPVLSSIPLLENALQVRRKRRLVWLAWSSATIIGITLMSGSMYYYMSSSS